MLASVTEQASLSLTWSETPEDTFSHDEVHIQINEIQENVDEITCIFQKVLFSRVKNIQLG